MTRRMTFLLLCTFPALASAQAGGRSDAQAKAALAPLMKLVGQWDGDARVSLMPGQSQVVRQHYDVTQGPGGTTLNLKGTGESRRLRARTASFFRRMRQSSTTTR